MDIKSVNFNSVQKTNFGLMTSAARKQLNSLIKQNNSGMDADGQIKFDGLVKFDDFILDYDSRKNAYNLHSTDYRVSAFVPMHDKLNTMSKTNMGSFLRLLYSETFTLNNLINTGKITKREQKLTLNDFNEK